MRKLSRLLRIILVSLLLTSFQNAQHSSIAFASDSYLFTPPDDHEPGQHNIRFGDDFTDYNSYLINTSLLADTTKDPTCQDAFESKCQNAQLSFNAIIPFCDASIKINCVEDVGAISKDGSILKAKSIRRFPNTAQNEFQGNETIKLPNGGTGTIVDIPEARHAGGSNYLVTAFMSGSIGATKTDTNLNSFVLRITPIRLVESTVKCIRTNDQNNTCVDSGFANVLGSDGVRRWGSQGPGTDGKQACAVRSLRENLCAEIFAFPTDYRFYLQVKTNLAPTGWLHGRVYEPKINISKNDSFAQIRVEANPVSVPMLYKSNYWKDLPENIKTNYDPSTGQLINGESSGFSRIPLPNQNNPLTRNLTLTPTPFSSSGIRELQIWLPQVQDKATALQSAWNVRSLSAYELAGSNSCFTNSTNLNGIVTTNSTQYSAGPPKLNQVTKTLDYQVASPHFEPSGTVARGQYSLVMASSVARCVYGFTSAPIKAELSVVSNSGEKQAATFIINEKDGWLTLNANNFEYSAPTISATLTQETPMIAATPTPIPSIPTNQTSAPPVASPTSIAPIKPSNKIKTIICIKGKTLKKVTATNPKCPIGYKLKG